MLPSIKVRENSILGDSGNDRKTFKNINKWLLENNIAFDSIEIIKPSLEDVFLKLTGTEGR